MKLSFYYPVFKHITTIKPHYSTSELRGLPISVSMINHELVFLFLGDPLCDVFEDNVAVNDYFVSLLCEINQLYQRLSFLVK